MSKRDIKKMALNFKSEITHNYVLINADCCTWLKEIPENTIHAIVTDPPYGIKEYTHDQLEKRQNGNGGIWRIPPSFDGHKRSPLPRFTALTNSDRKILFDYFREWSLLVCRVLTPGAHVFIATNSFLSPLVCSALSEGGLEFRSQIIRLVRTFRGGDRPKNAEKEFPGVCSMPRGCYEPWGLFRKPLPQKMTVAECLREFKTGGLRRLPDDSPFSDVIDSGRTPQVEKKLANHPSLKPQDFLRSVVYSALPLGEGVILDPFMGSGSTIAAASVYNYSSVGIERNPTYYSMAVSSIPDLVCIELNSDKSKASGNRINGHLFSLNDIPIHYSTR